MASHSSQSPLPVPAGPSDFGAGGPFSFVGGGLQGHRLRLQVEELQTADRARKYARKDRRPLDPPPVARLRIFEVREIAGREVERELDNPESDIRCIGLMCHVDLFRVPGSHKDPHKGAQDLNSDDEDGGDWPVQTSVGESQHHASHSSAYPMQGVKQHPSAYRSDIHSPTYSSGPFLAQPSAPGLLVPASWPSPTTIEQPATYGGSSLQFSAYPQPALPVRQFSTLPSPLPPRPTGLDPDIVAFYGDEPIKESSACTKQLVGDKFSHAISVDWEEKRMLMFVFSDLAVRAEGIFLLRYRVFNVFSQVEGDTGHRVLAEAYGGPFKVYSTKDFPGLLPSTPLTKHLLDSGVKVIVRETERRRRPRVVEEPVLPTPQGA